MGILAALMAAVAATSAPAGAPPCVRLAAPPTTCQLVTVEAAAYRTTHATLTTWARAGKCWTQAGGPWPARVGRNGLSDDRREGDGTTPAGSFAIGRMMYGTAPNPGVSFAYRRLRCGDWWNEDVSSPTYNSFQHVRCGTSPPFATKTPGMWQQPVAYPHLAVVEFNMRPVVPGRGSGIFLHAQTGRATSGCISLARPALVRVLRWLRPDARPRIVIGTPARVRL